MSTDTTTKKKALKPLEVGAGAGAAVITAFASSYLGTAGTLTGAALASVVGTVSTSVLRDSAERSAERLRESTARLRDLTARTETHPADPLDPYGTQLFGAPDLGTGATAQPGPAPAGSGPAGRDRRPRWVILAAGAVAAFAVALVTITGIESAAGKPLAGLVGDETGGGTTIGRATGADPGAADRREQDPTPAPATTPAPGSTASPTATTPSTATTPTTEPTATPTAEPSPTATEAPATTAPAPTATTTTP